MKKEEAIRLNKIDQAEYYELTVVIDAKEEYIKELREKRALAKKRITNREWRYIN